MTTRLEFSNLIPIDLSIAIDFGVRSVSRLHKSRTDRLFELGKQGFIGRFTIIPVFLILTWHLDNENKTKQFDGGTPIMTLTVTSCAFHEGELIPRKYSGDGDDISPPLSWSGIPEGSKSLALISDDPDAPMGNWVHWVCFNIPPNEPGLTEKIPPVDRLENGAKQGINDFRQLGYGGPCPPSGTHRYYFKLYALDTVLNLRPGITKKELESAMKGHVLAQGQIMGKYKRG